MKKRLLSCLALLLLMATLLCSCVEGLPFSELYFAASDTAADYAEQLKLLQEGSKIIAANGESEYVIECTTTFVEIGNRTNDVKAAINTLAERIEAQTGADLLAKKRDKASKRIIIGLTQGDETTKVSTAAQFYIGFSGDDLIIQASNGIMLISALNYFADTYLGEKNELILSPDLSYLSPTATYHTREHNLIRAEQSGAVATQAVTTFCDTLFEVAGVRFSVKSDFNTSGGLTDILFGYPDTEEANAILSTLGHDDFYIGVHNEKLMILAKNDPALERATRTFLNTFVRAEDAAFDKSDKTITLPAVCDYYYRSDAMLLTENGVNHAVLVYEAGLSSDAKNAVNKLATLYKRLTNTELPVYADSEYAPGSGALEILVGETNRVLPQQPYLEGMPSGCWLLSAVPEYNTILLYAKDDLALMIALKQLESVLTEQTRAISKLADDAEGWIRPGTNRTIYIDAELHLSGLEPPDLPVASIHYIYTSSYRVIATKAVSRQKWHDYRWKIQASGFKAQSYTDEDGVVTWVYKTNTRTATLIYNLNDQSMELRVVQTPNPEE